MVCEPICPKNDYGDSQHKIRDENGTFLQCSDCPDPTRILQPATDGVHDYECVCPESEDGNGNCVPSENASNSGAATTLESGTEGNRNQVTIAFANDGLNGDENPPVPEMSVLLIPAAFGLAGLFAYRARRKSIDRDQKE